MRHGKDQHCLPQAVSAGGCCGKPPARSHVATGWVTESGATRQRSGTVGQGVQPPPDTLHGAHTVSLSPGGAVLKPQAGRKAVAVVGVAPQRDGSARGVKPRAPGPYGQETGSSLAAHRPTPCRVQRLWLSRFPARGVPRWRGAEGAGAPATPQRMTGRPDRANTRPGVQPGERVWCASAAARLFVPPVRPLSHGGTNGVPPYTHHDNDDSRRGMMNKRDGRLIARARDTQVCKALHRFGWLSTRLVAALLWQRWAFRPSAPPHMEPAQPTASAVRMAQRTLRRLHVARMVIKGQGPDGSVIYALSEGGARMLREAGAAAISGKDLVRRFSPSYYRHRCIANEIAISGILQGFRASTEREIAQGLWLGGAAGVAGKRPDVLLRSGNQVWWVEVERSRKTAKEYKALLAWMGRVLQDKGRRDDSRLLGPGQVWGRVTFICTQAFEAKLRRDLEGLGWTRQQVDALSCFQVALYRIEDTLFCT